MYGMELDKRIGEWRYAMDKTEHFSLDRTAPENIPDVWDKISKSFDVGLGQDTTRVERTIEILGQIGALDENTVALDIGCGTGSFTLELARHCKKVYALDISPKMLDALEGKAKERGVTNIERFLGDWKSLELTDFDKEITLALSCLNTGINDFESLDKMNKVSNKWCCYITVSGSTSVSSRSELQEIVFGRILKTAFGNDVLFPFNIIYTMGLRPELRYVPCSWNRSMTGPEAVAWIVDDYSRYKDIDDATAKKIEDHVSANLNKEGLFVQDSSTTLGVMTWKRLEA